MLELVLSGRRSSSHPIIVVALNPRAASSLNSGPNFSSHTRSKGSAPVRHRRSASSPTVAAPAANCRAGSPRQCCSCPMPLFPKSENGMCPVFGMVAVEPIWGNKLPSGVEEERGMAASRARYPLDPMERAVAEEDEGPLLVVAGSGTGRFG